MEHFSAREHRGEITWTLYHRRVERLARFLEPEDKSILDLGAGDMHLRSLLSGTGTEYYPVDYVKRDATTIVADLKARQFPDIKTDVVFMSGILEYIEDKQWLLERAADTAQRKILISYDDTALLLDVFRRCGFLCVEIDRDTDRQTGHCFVRAKANVLPKSVMCCGCGACVSICPTGAMAMTAADYDSYRPRLTESACTDCGKCVKACPMLQKTKKSACEPKTYEAIAASEQLVAKSASGGVFSLFSHAALERGGAVAGVQFGEDFMPEFAIAENETDLTKMRKSKYVQARTGDVFVRTEQMLKKGRLILFSGCPCQIAGLKSYLGKSYDNLYTIDLLCKYSPPQAFWKQYFAEEFATKDVSAYEFRSKEHGWNIDCLKITFSDGSEEVRRLINDPYQRVFHSQEMMPEYCAYCYYQAFPREGDITIGDFHGIADHDPFLDEAYKKGISVLMVNTSKGEQLLEWIRTQLRLLKEVPRQWIGGNAHGFRLRNGEPIHPAQAELVNLLKNGKSFREAVDIVKRCVSHIALVGSVSTHNFGAFATNLALWLKLRDFGYVVDLLMFPRSADEAQYQMSKYTLSEQLDRDYADSCMPLLYSYAEMQALLQNRYRLLVTGSDQVFRPDFCFHNIATLRWLNDDTPRICYASSFGIGEPDKAFPYVFDQILNDLSDYDRISVRESDAVALLAAYGIEATHTLEPVLLHDADFWSKYAAKRESSGHIFAYILDPNAEKDLLLGFVRGKLGVDVEQFGEMWHGGTFAERMGSIMNASFVVTDSFHGMCFAIIFKKPFIVIMNRQRGAPRFRSILNQLGLQSRLVESPGEVLAMPELFEPMDWSHCDAALEQFRSESLQWLKDAVEQGIAKSPEPPKQNRTVDENLIWYGAGLGAQRLLLFLDKLGLPSPNEIWDRDAWHGRELGGVPVTLPRFEELRDRKGVKIVITIEVPAINAELVREFKNHGVDNIITFDEIDRQFRTMLRGGN